MKITDRLAKTLWSGDVRESDGKYRAGNLSGGVRKQDGERLGQVPEHVVTPFRGKPRPFNPFGLRRLADTEAVQSAVEHIISDLKAIDTATGPTDPDNPVADEVSQTAERHMQRMTPNDESRSDVDEALWRDLLEVGNAVAVKNFQIDNKRVEVNPLDPNTFTVDWDSHRVIRAFWQYPQAGSGFWGQPTRFDPEQIIWETLGKETSRAMIYGHSPTEKLQRVINIIGGLMDSEERELEEGMPPGIVSLVGDWSDNDYNRFEDYWENNVKGEQHKVPLAKGEAKFEPFTASYKDLQILDRQQWYFKLVGAIFKVPVSENGLAIGEEMTRATDVSQRQRYKQKTIQSLLNEREETWNKEFIQSHFTEDLEFRYEPGLDLMEKKELASMATTLVEKSILNINEGREMLGKEPKDWGEGPPPNIGSNSGSGGGGGGGPLSDIMGGQSTEADNQNALTEGLEPMMETDQEVQERQEKDFSGPQGGSHSCSGVAKDGDMSIEDTPLRQSADYQEMSFQPKEIKALLEDVSDVYRKYLESVLDDIKANSDKWTAEQQVQGGEAEKALPDFFQLIEQDIRGVMAKELGEVVATHKARKVLDGQDSIEGELAQAGLDTSDIELGEFTDRVANRLERRTMQVSQDISQRLEGEIKDTLQEGWSEGKSITDIERDIESLTDKWTDTEAERLARDQMGKAAKEGRMEFARETAGEVGGWSKQWITNIDGRERDAHALMDGETVPLEEPFVVDYNTEDQNGPSGVEEEYPGDSQWGIQCRCDYELIPRGVVQNAKEWGQSVESDAREEVRKQHGMETWKTLLRKELAVQRGDLSRSQAWQDIGLGSKATYYKWIEQSGLKGSL